VEPVAATVAAEPGVNTPPIEEKLKGKSKGKSKANTDMRKSANCLRTWLVPAIAQPKIVVNPELEWLVSLNISARFVDESHFGGATELAQQTLACFGANAFTVYITATYDKPVNTYNIPRERCILWTLVDITACKRFADIDPTIAARAQNFVYNTYASAEAIFGALPPSQIANMYNEYPHLTVLTRKITDEIVNELCVPTGTPSDSNKTYGWTVKACLLLNQSAIKGKSVSTNTFQNPTETLKLLYDIFGGPKNKFNRPMKTAELSFIDRAREICANGDADTRFFGLPDADTEPAIILTFLPAVNVDATSAALKALIELHNVLPEYDICIINSAQTTDPVATITEARARAKIANKRAVLVLSGRQCSLGITLHGCDVVILLNGTDSDDGGGSTDLIYQMMFRSMTEAKGKKFGFVIDLDVQRAMRTIMANVHVNPTTYRPDSKLAETKHTQHSRREAVHYLLRERIISLNPDHWEPQFGYNSEHANAFFEKAYKVYSAKAERMVGDIMSCIKLKTELFTRDNFAILRAFGNLTTGAARRIRAAFKGAFGETKVGAGIEKAAIQRDTDEIKGDAEDDEEDIDENDCPDPNEMLRSLVPLLVLLSLHLHTTTLRHMLACVEADDTVREVLMDRTRAWWGDNGRREVLHILIDIFEMYVCDEYTQMRIENLKDIFVENKDCAAKLSAIIDTHLIPLESEKKAHAEVSTPIALRKEMMDKIPAEFWTTPKKVLEPCAGKGGFLVDILERFMIGLEPLIPDVDERRRVIVEDCLYWADINPFNVWVCTFLLNLGGERKVNGYLGDSLELDTNKEWGIMQFDAVVGNPPYSTDPSLKTAKPLYNLFVEKYIDYAQYLLFVIPSRWFVGGKGLDAFRAFMTVRTDISLIIHEDDAVKWFGKCVDIKGGAHYFLKNKLHNGPCMFNNVEYNLSTYDCVIKPKYHSLVNICSVLPSITELYMGRRFGIESNDSRLCTSGTITCFVSRLKASNRRMAIPEYTFTEENTYWKVITPKASLCAFTGFGEIFTGKPDEVHTGSYISFRTNSKECADSLASYMKTKFANHMLSIRKISHNLCKDTCKWIPLVPLDREWTDDAVCAHFGIDQASYTA
jgi:site-specific DNA-methyltransferase (adenine-specific)